MIKSTFDSKVSNEQRLPSIVRCIASAIGRPQTLWRKHWQARPNDYDFF